MLTIFIAIAILGIITAIIYRPTVTLVPIKLKRVTQFRKLCSVLVVFPLMLPSLAGAHGNVTLEEDVCVQRVGGISFISMPISRNMPQRLSIVPTSRLKGTPFSWWISSIQSCEISQ